MQIAISKWLKLQHKEVYFTFDPSGLKLPIGLASKAKQMRSPERGWADMLILEPNREHNGLLIELKKDRAEVYTKAGSERVDEHNREQRNFMNIMRYKGYAATYAFSVDDAIQKIESYLKKR